MPARGRDVAPQMPRDGYPATTAGRQSSSDDSTLEMRCKKLSTTS
jgi:hypothetical protein